MSLVAIDPLDPRRNAIRDDLADARLRGSVERERYAEPLRKTVCAPSVKCVRHPERPTIETEFLFGEELDVFATEASLRRGATGTSVLKDTWCWVQSAVDGYVGYVPTDALSAPLAPATHRVSVPQALVFGEADIHRHVIGALYLNAKVRVVETLTEGEVFHAVRSQDLHHLGDGNALDGFGEHAFILDQHLLPAGSATEDWVAIAEQFVGTPYLWGGKTWAGLDCSGLIQVALQASGRASPRDSDMQAAELGEALSQEASLQRGDLVFWRGHVGIMIDEGNFLHANGHHMRTVVEPLNGAADRLRGKGLPVTVRRRLRR